jgi:hypothetical protein
MKRFTQKEIREMVAKTKRDGAVHVAFHAKNGQPEMSFVFPVTKAQASRLLGDVMKVREQNAEPSPQPERGGGA